MTCKPYTKSALERGTKTEHKDHLCEKGGRAYP